MARYANTQMTLVWCAAVLCALSANPSWAGAPTEQLRTDLIAAIDELGNVLPLLPRGLYPRPAPELADGLQKLRAALAAWEPPARVPDELSSAAMELIAAMLRAAYSPPAPPEREGPPRPSVDEQGLPVPRGGTTLLHNAPAGALVCVVDSERVPGRFPTKRMFVRRYEEPAYREVVFEGERLVPSDVVTAPPPRSSSFTPGSSARMAAARTTAASTASTSPTERPHASTTAPLAAPGSRRSWVRRPTGALSTSSPPARGRRGQRVALWDTVSHRWRWKAEPS